MLQAMARTSSSFNDREDFVLTKNRVLHVIELDLGAGVLSAQNRVALLDVELHALAVVVVLAVADGDHFRFLRLLFRGVGVVDPSANLFFRILAPDDDPVVQRAGFELSCDCHSYVSFLMMSNDGELMC